MTRSYHIEHKPDLRGWGLHWRLHTSGMGNGYVGGSEAGSYRTEAEANEAGRRWVETGLPAAVEQIPASLTTTLRRDAA